MTTQILNQAKLKELFNYDPDTGIVTRKMRLKNQPAGAKVGCIGTRGYLQTSINGKVYKVHRLIWMYVYGNWPKDQIDHINHNTSDNQITNLREVSCAENHQNRCRQTKSSSKMLGVGWHKRDKCWVAHLEIDGKRHNLGYYSDKESALEARKVAELLYHPHRPN